jgi:predicted nucleic acid-binding protein
MNYLLDSSALLAFYFGEPGSERVREIMSDDRLGVGLSVLTAAEFWSRLRAEGWEHVFDEEWHRVSDVMTLIAPVSFEVVRRSLDVRVAARARLPQIDALIAGTALVHDAVLVHRDAHFLSVPGDILQQEFLPET